MKTLGEAAMDLPWIAPSVASLTMLARSPFSAVWTQIRTDPGLIFLSARFLDSSQSPDDTALLEAVLRQQPNLHLGFVDWNQPGADVVRRVCYQQALLASQLADKVGCHGLHAWIAGFLVPLGWLAVTAADPGRSAGYIKALNQNNDPAAWQRQAWGLDHTALARRLSRGWRLPAWLTAVVSHLGLHARIAERLGAEAKLFQVVQLAIALLQERQRGLGLPVGAELADLLTSLKLDAAEVAALAEQAVKALPPAQGWESPAAHPLLADLLQLALENRRQNDSLLVERLQEELDRMQEALVQQGAGENDRLQTLKLSALAEFAAGAGHEINNPLAVISGQAQYVLKQLDWLDVPAEEIENVAEYLENLRTKIAPSLHKIIGQTQRVHGILTDLMQFARPSSPRLQPVSISTVIGAAAESLQGLAQQRQVQLVFPARDHDDFVHADPGQVRLALVGLLRNAIEAAPAEGWAGIRVEKQTGDALVLVVEDNGKGPPPGSREHLFDPFFSGRSAGRGRGLGLPTAWRLARQQGGDVRFDGIADGVTRFVLSLPRALAGVGGIGYHTDSNGGQAVHPPIAS